MPNEAGIMSNAKITANHKIEVRDTEDPIRKKGAFAKEKIFKGEIIGEETGQILSNEEYRRLPERHTHYCIDIDDNRVFCAANFENPDSSWFVNHSCNPNIGSSGNIYYLVAMRDIKPGEELTLDYAMVDSDTSTPWVMECHCGSENCRKKITASDWQIQELQQKYKGYFQKNVQEKIDQQNH